MMTNSINLSLPWSHADFIVLDLEGTGAQHKELEGIVEIAAIILSNKQLTDNHFYKLLNPEIAIPSFISKIHGIKNKDVECEPMFSAVKQELLSFIDKRILVGHNVKVDYRVLKLKMPEYVPAKIIDTMKISRYLWGNTVRHGLDDLITRYNLSSQLVDLPMSRNRHSAYYDAYATGLVFMKLIEEKFTDNTTLRELLSICEINPTQENNQASLF